MVRVVVRVMVTDNRWCSGNAAAEISLSLSLFCSLSLSLFYFEPKLLSTMTSILVCRGARFGRLYEALRARQDRRTSQTTPSCTATVTVVWHGLDDERLLATLSLRHAVQAQPMQGENAPAWYVVCIARNARDLDLLNARIGRLVLRRYVHAMPHATAVARGAHCDMQFSASGRPPLGSIDIVFSFTGRSV